MGIVAINVAAMFLLLGGLVKTKNRQDRRSGTSRSNAVDALKREADYVTDEEDGRGVSEAISRYCGAAG